MDDNEDIKSILDEAIEIVSGSRQQDYGHPYNNHTTTSELWSTYIRRALNPLGHPREKQINAEDFALSAIDVCMLMILMKVARHAHKEKRDNLVDIAGWAHNAQIIDDYIDEMYRAHQQKLKEKFDQ